MDISIIAIGNSRGIRLPKSIIQKCGFGSKVHMTIKGSKVILEASSEARAGWNELFEAELKRHPEDTLDWAIEGGNEWDKEGWEWQ